VSENNREVMMYTEDQLMARLRFFIGICLALTLTGIVFVVLYSLIFVTQPMNAISPMDQKFFELIIPIATFLTGTLSGIMLAGNDKDAKLKAIDAATRPTTVSPMPQTTSISVSSPIKTFTPPSPPPGAVTAPPPLPSTTGRPPLPPGAVNTSGT